MIRCSHLHGVMFLVTALVLASCHGQPTLVVEPEETERDPCLIGRFDAAVDSVVIGLDSVFSIPATVVPKTNDERLVFRQVYQSLVSVDCRGRVRPAVADTWVVGPDERTWTFRLSGARFSDGVRVTALHILDAWERVWPDVSASLPAGEYFNFDAAVTEDAIVVVLERADPDFPRKLARPGLAVARYDATGLKVWPVGTTGVVPVQSPGVSSSQILLARGDTHYPTLVFAPFGSTDPRDALDANLDVVIGGGRAFLDYAERRLAYVNFPLPWDRTYGLVMSQPDELRGSTDRNDWWVRLANARENIARDAVGMDAHALACNVSWGTGNTVPEALPSPTGTILYDVMDQTAREIAERIVATDNIERVSGTGNGRLRTQGVVDSVLVRRVVQGGSAGVWAIRTGEGTPCELDSGMSGMSWASAIVLPLIQTRRHVVIRDGRASATVHGDGVVQFFVPSSR